MREQETSPDFADWVVDDSSESFVMTHGDLYEGGRQRRLYVTLGTLALVALVLVASTSAWLPAAQRGWARLFPPPPYTGALTIVREQNEARVLALRRDTGQVQWSYKPTAENSTPILAGDVVVAVDTTGIVGLRVVDGHVLWHTTTPEGQATPQLFAVDANQLIVQIPSLGGPPQFLYQALSVRTGAIRWQQQGTGYPVYPTGGRNLLICDHSATADGTIALHLTALDAASGTPLWTTPTVRANANGGWGFCASNTTQAYIDAQPMENQSTNTSELWGFSRQTGQMVWHHAFRNSVMYLDDQRFLTTNWYISQPQTAPPVLAAYDAATGVAEWQIAGRYTPLIYTDSQAFGDILPVKTPTGIAGVDVRSGKTMWRIERDDTAQFWLATYGANNVLYYFNETDLYALDTATGHVLWDKIIPSTGAQSQVGDIVIRDQRVYLATTDGTSVFDAIHGRLLWHLAKSYYLVS